MIRWVNQLKMKRNLQKKVLNRGTSVLLNKNMSLTISACVLHNICISLKDVVDMDPEIVNEQITFEPSTKRRIHVYNYMMQRNLL